MLICISEVLQTPVSTLLGQSVAGTQTDALHAISEKLEVINLQLARRQAANRNGLHWLFLVLCAVIAAAFALLLVLDSPYLGWDYSQPEFAVSGVMFHAFEWLFVRIAPLVFAGSVVGACLTRKKA